MNHIEQARHLKRDILSAKQKIRGRQREYTEAEVKYRLDIVCGFLQVAANEAEAMAKCWEDITGKEKAPSSRGKPGTENYNS